MHKRTTDAAETAIPLPERQGRSYTPRESEQGRAMTNVEAGRLAGRPRASREPLVRPDRLVVTAVAGMFVLLAAILSVGVVGFTTLSSQILDLQKQIGDFRVDVHEEIGGLRAEMHEEIGGLRAEMHEEIGGLRAEMREEFGKVSDRMGQLSERITRVETLIETHLVPASNVRDPAGP